MEKHPPLCSRVVNYFRIQPEECENRKGETCYLWKIVPNRSERTFYFNKISLAEDFAKSFKNYHSSAFWYNLWIRNNLFRKDILLVFTSPLDYML